MKLRSKDGVEMMDVKSIEADADKLVLKGKMMGSMAATIHVQPKDLWDAFTLLSPRTKLRLPLFLYRGWRASAKKPAP
ncbi:MAG: hypothetical protein ACRYG8_26830 [Janthinobacterium lividum]